jgi:hypothetical protein
VIRFCVVVLIVTCAVLAITNPGLDAHKKVVYTSVATDATGSEALGKIAVDFLGNENVLPLTYNNYYLFSTTTLKDHTASIGILSKVRKTK